MNNIFDSHAHYDAKQFNPDRDGLLSSLPSHGVRLVMTAADTLASARRAVALAKKYDFIYCSAGIHPHDAKSAPKDMEAQIREIVKSSPKVRAVGECGLDYHYDFSPRDIQLEVFERQLILAGELSMPVIVHSREAHADVLRLLRQYKPRGVVHCYSGSAQMAGELLQLGLYIGFTGVVTFPNARKVLEAAAAVPLDRLLVETDCPYMAPVPFRGKRCDSSMLPHTIGALAALHNVDAQELADITFKNACELFQIDCRHVFVLE
jgi:TatD DNase family protein